MDNHISACFTLSVSPCLLPPTPYFAPLVVSFSFLFFHFILNPSIIIALRHPNITIQNVTTQISGKVGFLHSLPSLKPRPGRLEPCCASVSLGASGPSRPLSQDPNPPSATPPATPTNPRPPPYPTP